MGTAGAGDVLGGLLGTLLAAGLDPLDAGALGALVHGVAADRTNPGGPVRISEVARRIPETVAALLRLSRVGSVRGAEPECVGPEHEPGEGATQRSHLPH